MNSIFLSYSSEDRPFVNRLAIDLRARGFNVWYDQWQLNVGDSLLEKIQEGIKHSSWLSVVLSPHAVASKWVKEELNSALAKQLAANQVYVLPILYKDCDIPLFLSDKVYADFRQDYNGGLQRLLSTLRRRYVQAPVDEVNYLKWFSRSYSSTGGIYRARYPEPYKVSPDDLTADSLSGLWRGPTGRLRLALEQDKITGEYDWNGFEYSGSIQGTVKSNAIAFEWNWKVSGEYGGGLFYLPLPDLLIGGWWMNYDYIDAQELLDRHEMPPNHWSFNKD